MCEEREVENENFIRREVLSQLGWGLTQLYSRLVERTIDNQREIFSDSPIKASQTTLVTQWMLSVGSRAIHICPSQSKREVYACINPPSLRTFPHSPIKSLVSHFRQITNHFWSVSLSLKRKAVKQKGKPGTRRSTLGETICSTSFFRVVFFSLGMSIDFV